MTSPIDAEILRRVHRRLRREARWALLGEALRTGTRLAMLAGGLVVFSPVLVMAWLVGERDPE